MFTSRFVVIGEEVILELLLLNKFVMSLITMTLTVSATSMITVHMSNIDEGEYLKILNKFCMCKVGRNFFFCVINFK